MQQRDVLVLFTNTPRFKSRFFVIFCLKRQVYLSSKLYKMVKLDIFEVFIHSLTISATEVKIHTDQQYNESGEECHIETCLYPKAFLFTNTRPCYIVGCLSLGVCQHVTCQQAVIYSSTRLTTRCTWVWISWSVTLLTSLGQLQLACVWIISGSALTLFVQPHWIDSHVGCGHQGGLVK